MNNGKLLGAVMTSREKDPISNFRATFIFVSFASNFFLVLPRKMLLLAESGSALHIKKGA